MKKKSRLQLLILFVLLSVSALQLSAAEPDKVLKSTTLNAQAVRVCPGGSIMAELQAPGFVEARVSVQNAAGKVLTTRPVVLDPGKNLLQFKISEIPAGAYFIHVKSAVGTEKITFVVHG